MPVAFYPAGPAAIRMGTVACLKAAQQALGLTEIFTFRTQPTQEEQVPYAIVWNVSERTEPNGDGNVGAPSFLHHLTLVVDVMASAASDAELDTEIVSLVEAIRSTLMCDPDWVMLFEGIERCDTRYSAPKDASDKLAQAMIEVEVTYRSDWEPNLPNAFLELDLKTTVPHAGVEVLVEIPQS